MPPTSRRNFLQSTTVGVTASALMAAQPHLAFGLSGPRIRVAVIGRTGKGDYGHGVDLAFTKIPNAEIVAVSDEDPAGREKAQQRLKAPRAYSDFRDMLKVEFADSQDQDEALKLVAICPRWIDQHHDAIVAAAEVGAHIYMEKPFCPTLVECDDAIEKLNAKSLKLGMAHVSRYSPVLDVVRACIEQDEIGEVLEIRGRGKEDHRGGGEDLWVLGSHIFGLMNVLAGSAPRRCTATVKADGEPVVRCNVVQGAEGIGPLAGDEIHAIYEFDNGVRGFFGSRRSVGGNPSRFAIQVFGSKGIIEMTTGYLDPAYLLRDSSWSPGRSGKVWEPITSAGIGKPEPRTDGSYEGGHIAAINDLIAAADSDRDTRCSADDGRAIVEMIAAVFESHRVRGPVELPLVTRVNPLTLL